MRTVGSGQAPPHNLDEEAAILNTMLVNHKAMDLVLPILEPECFFSPRYGDIYRAIQHLVAKREAVDAVAIGNILRDWGKWDSHKMDLIEAVDYAYSITKVETHAKKLRNLWRVRRTIEECHRIAAEGYGQFEDVDSWLNESASKLATIADDDVSSETKTLTSALQTVFENVSNQDYESEGLCTGIEALDTTMGKLRPGQLVIVAAHSGMGKTALAMDIVINTQKERPEQAAACIFSAEMLAEELAERTLFGRSGVDSSLAQRKDLLRPDHWARLSAGSERISLLGRGVYIDDRSDLSVLEVRAKARRIKLDAEAAGRKLQLIVADYAQLFSGRGAIGKGDNREREVNAIGEHFKHMAKELRVPVILLAQLNDDVSKRGGNAKPRGEDLRESKALKMHADKIVLIWNQEARQRALAFRNKDKPGDTLPVEPVEFIVDKARGGGRTGIVKAMFEPQFTHFRSMTDSELEWVLRQEESAA